MELIINIRGVEDHLSYVEEELREIKKFEERFERYQAENPVVKPQTLPIIKSNKTAN